MSQLETVEIEVTPRRGLTACPERLSELMDEFRVLMRDHYDELSWHKRHGFPLDPQFDMYFERERNGTLLFVALRSEGRLVGYFAGILGMGAHYKTCFTMIGDLFWVHPDHRGRGGLVLFKALKKELVRRGVKMATVGRKIDSPVDPTRLFQFFGFVPFEETFCLWLDEE